MKYLQIYEAFESNAISKVTKYIKNKVGEKDSNKFLQGLRNLMDSYDLPINKISDDDVSYLSSKKALPINSNEELENEKGIYCLKFWFSLNSGYIGYTGVGNRKMENFIQFEKDSNRKRRNDDRMTDRIFEYIKDTLDIKTGKLTRVSDYSSLRHGDDIIACFDGSISFQKIAKGKIYLEDEHIYAIQNVSSGSSPNNSDTWTEWGNYSWSIGSIGDIGGDHMLLYKYTEGDKPLIVSDYNKVEEVEEVTDSPFIFNLPLSNYGKLINWSRYKDEHSSLYNKNWKDVEDADFAIVIYLDKILNSDFTKRSEMISDREENRRGALKFKSDDDIRKANIERYMNTLVGKMGIKEDSLDLKNLQKYISTNILGDYSYFSIQRNRPDSNSIHNFSERLIDLMNSIKEDRSEDRIKSRFERVVSQYKHSNQDAITYRNYVDKNYKIYSKLLDKGEQFELLKEYVELCKNIGIYIKNYTMGQEINSIEEYIFLYNKIISIRNIMLNDMFKPKSTPIKHTIGEMFNNRSDSHALINYMNNESNLGDIKTMKSDIKGLKNIEKYIKSILN